MQQLEALKIQIYPLPDCDDDEDFEYREQCKQLKVCHVVVVVVFGCMSQLWLALISGVSLVWGVCGALVESTPFVQRVIGSTPSLAAT